ncbi:tail fiber domain-containing protein, partial [Flavobacteriaceae bacterium]|nr:tail fiber domain-containing protein [Flavobacteriaceae bacterium]
TTASGNASTAMGLFTTASATSSTAMGYGTTASDYASTVIGHYNSSGSSATSANSFSTSNTAFVIGNGADSSNKSDAFKVMFNGDTTVSNDLTVSGDVVVSSDARLKSNIVSLGSTLSRLLLIDGKSYEMKGKQKIGVLAQDIKEVFPELVSEDDNEMLAVNYQGLVPVLINALKEQQSEIEILKQQQAEIDELKEMVNQLISSK